MLKDRKNTAIYTAFDEWDELDIARPEKNLLRAVLASAMNDLKKPGDSHRRAMEYFLSSDDSYIFSFRSICNFLEIDPRHVLLATGVSRDSYDEDLPLENELSSLGELGEVLSLTDFQVAGSR